MSKAIPKGLCPPAQGCEERATLGNITESLRDFARTSRLRTRDRTVSTSENPCKHYLRTDARLKYPERPMPHLGAPTRPAKAPSGGGSQTKAGRRGQHSNLNKAFRI